MRLLFLYFGELDFELHSEVPSDFYWYLSKVKEFFRGKIETFKELMKYLALF